MSDAFGPDTSTATGGLSNDMPGMGVAPPSAPRGVPNALGGLVSAFQQMFGGRPAPQGPGPGRSPFQAPGQSQIPTSGEGGPTPPPQPSQRWTGTTASAALPRGAEQPPARFTPFIKSLPTRGYDQWGTAEQFPTLPQSFEVPSILNGVSQFFGQNGSQLSMPIALLMGRYAGDYMKGVMQGQEFKAKMAKEQYELNAQKLQDQQEAEHHVYGDIYAEYAALSGTSDPAKMLKTINGVDLRGALHDQAAQLGDDKVMALIENGAGINDIMEFQKLRDANLRDLQKANAKTDQQNTDDAMYGLSPQGSGEGQMWSTPSWAQKGSPLSNTGGQPTAPPNVAPGQPAPSLSPTQPDATGQVAGPGAPSGDQTGGQPDVDPELSKQNPDYNNPELRTAAHSIMQGGEPGSSEFYPPQMRMHSGKLALDMQNRLDELANSGLKGDDLANAVKKVDPTVYDDFINYASYKRGPGTNAQATGGRAQQYWTTLGRLATKYHPGDMGKNEEGWSQAIFQRVQQFGNENGSVQTTLRRANTTQAAGDQVLIALDQLKGPDGKIDQNQFATQVGYFVNHGTVDPRYAPLFRAWQSYNTETNVLASGRAGGSVTQEGRAEETVPQWFGNPEAYRRVIKADAAVASASINSYHQMWDQMNVRTITGEKEVMPGYNPEAETGIRNLMKMDPINGALPGAILPRSAVGLSGDGFVKYTGANSDNPDDLKGNWVSTDDRPSAQ